MSLAELLVFMFLMSLMMTAMYTVYVLCMRYMRITQASLDLQAQAQKAINAITRDVADSDSHPNAIVTSGISWSGQIYAGSNSVTIQTSLGLPDQQVIGWINNSITAGVYPVVTSGSGIWGSQLAAGTGVVPSGTRVTAVNVNTGVISLDKTITTSAVTTLGFTAGTDGIIIRTCRDNYGNIQAGPTWQAFVGYYVDDSHNLIRKRINFAPGAPAGVPTAPTKTLDQQPFTLANGYPYATDYIANFRSASGGRTQVLAIYDTSLVCAGWAPVFINGTFSTSVFNAGDCQINIVDAIWPRN